MDDLKKEIEECLKSIKLYIDQGWSLTMSLSKCGYYGRYKHLWLYESAEYKEFSKIHRKPKRRFC